MKKSVVSTYYQAFYISFKRPNNNDPPLTMYDRVINQGINYQGEIYS